jgi:hypothetical protein
MVPDLGFQVSGSGFRVPGIVFQVSGFGLRVWGLVNPAWRGRIVYAKEGDGGLEGVEGSICPFNHKPNYTVLPSSLILGLSSSS